MAAVTAFCSICSREKDERPELLPAYVRYKGKHVAIVAKAASIAGVPFYILSGIYGFIRGDEEVPYYDHLLQESEITQHMIMIVEQLRDEEISVLHFYCKRKPTWAPYLAALKQAAEIRKVQLYVHELDESI